jgi:hypothetical protein
MSAGRPMTRRSAGTAGQRVPGAEQLAGPGHRGEQEPGGQPGILTGGDPYPVRAGHLAAVDPAQFAEFHQTLRAAARPGRADRERAPTGRGPQHGHRYRCSAGQHAQAGDPCHLAQPYRARRAARPEAGDGRRGRGVGEHRRRGVEQVDRLAAKRAEEQGADQPTIVDVQPLGGGDQHSGSPGAACKAVARKKWACRPARPLAGTPSRAAVSRNQSFHGTAT